MSAVMNKKQSIFSFSLVIIYLFLEYIRPQVLIPSLTVLHLPAITVALIALSLIFSGKLSLKDKQTIFFTAIMLEMILHGPLAVNNYWAFIRFYEMSITFIAYLGIISFVDNEDKYKKLIKYWIILFIILAIIGILNQGIGTGGFIGDENDFCMAINMIIPFALFGVFSAKNKLHKIYFIVVACIFLSAVLTYSRGGFVGLVSVLIYCWLRSNKKVAFGLIIGLLFIFVALTTPSSYWNRVLTISDEYHDITGTEKQAGTGGQRIYAWKLGWKIFLDNPVIGVGQGNYPWHVGKVEEELGVLWQTRSLAGRVSHSLYFTLLPELGIIGVLLFSFMIAYSMKYLNYVKNVINIGKNIYTAEESKYIYYLALSLEGSLIGFLASSVFISTLYYPNIWILCGFIVSLRTIVYRKCGELNKINRNYGRKH